MTERGTSVSTRIGAYGTWASDWMMRRWISVAVVSSSTPASRRRRSRSSCVGMSGIFVGSPLKPVGRRERSVIRWPQVAASLALAPRAGRAGLISTTIARRLVTISLAVAVDDVAARRLDALLADLVVVRLGEVLVAGEHLQVPEPEEDDREERERDPAQDGDPPGELGADRRPPLSDRIDHESEVRRDPCVRRPCCSGESAAEDGWRRRRRGCCGQRARRASGARSRRRAGRAGCSG